MTGILPIRQYASSASLNMFKEYTMTFSTWYNEYFGFTDEEVDMLYQRYLKNNTNIVIGREGLREWYDGYYTKSGEKIYNPRSVVYALEGNELLDYWTKSGPFDDISYYIKNNVGDLKDDISKMLAGQSIRVDINEKKGLGYVYRLARELNTDILC